MPPQYDVLLVDDDAGIATVIKRGLAPHGVRCEHASNTDEARRLIERSNWHMVLLDLQLGGDRGEDVLKEIRRTSRMIPVIVLTGYPSIDSAVETARNGIAAYLQKPVGIEELWNVMQEHLRKSRVPQAETVAWLEEIGVQLRALRKIRGMTLKDLSDRAQVSAAMISKVERGKAATTLPTLYRLVRLMDGEIRFSIQET